MMRWHEKQALKREQEQLKKKLCLAVIVTVVFILLVLFTGNSEGYQDTVFIEYKVQAGDTLWDIAKEQRGERDVREVVYEIRQDNGIDPLIFPGQVLKIRQ